MGMHGSATSAAKVSLPSGIKDPGLKVIVENGKRISIEELKRSICVDGVNFFSSRRPPKSQVH